MIARTIAHAGRVGATAILLGACTAPYLAPYPYAYGSPGWYPGGLAPAGNLAAEGAERMQRFQRLSVVGGALPPSVMQVYPPPGSVPGLPGPVPVTRVVFEERAFFDFGSDVPRPETAPILDAVAETMRRDRPDAQITLLGHTDAVGSDEYNDALSLRRAQAVLQGLAARRVNPAQLSTVAIGKHQPLAPNTTEEGRARNRRVEFLVSASLDANLAVVREAGALASDAGRVRVAVLRPATAGPAGLRPIGEVELQQSGAQVVATQPYAATNPGIGFPEAPVRSPLAPEAAPARTSPRRPEVVRPAPVRVPELVKPADIERVPLGDKTTY